MAETFADQDLTTLRSIARGAGITDTERMPHDELVDMLRRAGLAELDLMRGGYAYKLAYASTVNRNTSLTQGSPTCT